MASNHSECDNEAEMKINLSALKKIDPDIEQIIDTASSVAHYKFLSTSGKWDKTEVEGSLFLYSRHSSPFVMVFIMNRLNKENTRLPLTYEMEFKVQQPFILCKSADSEIIGIWFYDLDECERFGALLKRLALLAKDERSLKMAIMMEHNKKKDQAEPVAKRSSKNSLLDMFNKAQQDYDKNHGVKKAASPNSNQVKQRPAKNSYNMAKRKSEPNLKAVLSHINEEQVTANDIIGKLQQAVQEKRDSDEKENKRYLFDESTAQRKIVRTRTISSSSEMDSLFSKRHEEEFSSRAGDLAIFNSLDLVNTSQIPKKNIIGCAELESKLLSEQVTSTVPRHISRSISFDSVNKSAILAKEEDLKLEDSILNSKGKPNVTLLSPSSLKTGKTGKGRGAVLNTLMSQQKISIAANFNNLSPNTAKLNPKKLFEDDTTVDVKYDSLQLNSLLSPAAFQRPTSVKQTDKQIANDNASNTLNSNADAILSKDQFKEALVHLIKTNSDFTTVLYNAYLESTNT